MIKEFHEKFGGKPSQVQEMTAFVNRAHSALVALEERITDYGQLFNAICFELGINPNDYHMPTHYGGFRRPSIGTLSGRDYVKTLELLIAVMKVLRARPEEFIFMDEICQSLMARQTTDLGIAYEDGMFYPKGEPALDNDLINHSLTVLHNFPAEDKDLRLALDNYRSGRTGSIVEICYRCIEGLTRQILGNNKTIIDNRPDLLSRLNLSDHWRKILVAYINYGNDFGRHASPERHNASPLEIEAYLYQTCLLIRLIVKIK